MEKLQKIDIAKPFLSVDEWKAIKKPIQNGWITQGKLVTDFESSFSNFHRTPFALATTSCTTALHLGLIALGVKPGDEVIVPSFTWISTANVVEYCGAKPIFADVDPSTFNLDFDDVKRKLTKKTKVIIPVHLFGLCCDIIKLREIIPKNVKILEDAACASGSKFFNNFAGNIGDAATFSFHPRKIITTGEGGMLSTKSKIIYDEICKLRNMGASISDSQRHFGPTPYILPEFKILGYNYRMTDIQAAIGISQMKKLKIIISRRKEMATFYSESLSNLDWLILPKTPKNFSHAWQAYVTIVDPKKAPAKRNTIMETLEKKGISTRPGTQAVHMLGYYKKKYNIKSNDLPKSKFCYQNSMAIPLHNNLSLKDLKYVVKCIKNLDSKKNKI